MSRLFLLRTLAALLCGVAMIATAQKATERFIPIGQSPGLSGHSTVIGTISTFANGMLEFSVSGNTGPQRVRVTPATRIWLDRSIASQPTLAGSPAELRAGRRVEVKLADAATPAAADWIKIEVAAAP
jgi:hypothetical protein